MLKPTMGADGACSVEAANPIRPVPAHGRSLPKPNVQTLAVLGVAFFLALTAYFAIAGNPERLSHDMWEAFAWGREFQLGYYQHPFFWAWICGAWFLVFPHENWALGALSALNATLGLIGAYVLIGDFAKGRKRMAAAVLLLLTPCYTLYAFKYNANTIFLSIWPFTLHYFIRSIDDNRRLDAVLFGVFAGLALLSKYYSVILLATCFLAALAHPRRNEYFASASPYLSAIVAGAMVAPHVWWLLTHHAPPVHYLASMSGLPWSELARYVGGTILGALEMNAVMLLVVALVARNGPREWIQSWRRHWTKPRFRLLAILVLTPLILTLLSALLLRTRIYADMLVGIFPLVPLLAIDFFGVSDIDLLWLASSRIAAAIIVVGLALSPAISHFARHSANIVPYRDVAFEATRLWRLKTGSPLAIVTSDSKYELATAFYSPDRPQALIGFSYGHSLWLTPADIAARGLLSICPADRPRCVDRTAEFVTPESTTTRVSLAPFHRDQDGKSLDYILTMIPPHDTRNKFTVLGEARCRQIWTIAIGGADTLPGDKAGPYITNLALADADNDNAISQQEFMNACNMGLVRAN